jgi:hypothetical protein
MNTQYFVKRVRKCIEEIKNLDEVYNKSERAESFSGIQKEIISIGQDMTNPSLPCLHKLCKIAMKNDFKVADLKNSLL